MADTDGCPFPMNSIAYWAGKLDPATPREVLDAVLLGLYCAEASWMLGIGWDVAEGDVERLKLVYPNLAMPIIWAGMIKQLRSQNRMSVSRALAMIFSASPYPFQFQPNPYPVSARTATETALLLGDRLAVVVELMRRGEFRPNNFPRNFFNCLSVKHFPELSTAILEEGRLIAQSPSMSAHTPQASKRPDVTLDDEEEAILRTLAKALPRQLTHDQISGQSRLARHTVTVRMAALASKKCVAYPGGPKRGATITPDGQDVLARLANPAPR